ncbi:MAG TPA: cellulase family glycosylhydrolase [Solirubrobacteraceae bacterium]|nr:cellulase family glycosylhydrolase [Solirubrobacteraceae bacterium]
MSYCLRRAQGFSVRTTVFLVLLIFSIVVVPAAQAAEKGLQTDLTWSAPAADEPRTIAALEGTGVQWIRLDISWRKTERTRGVYDAGELAMTDRAMHLAAQAGAKIIMAVSETPAWASGSTAINTPPRDNADFANFVGDMVERYRGRVAGWEIWNEPNHPRFWHPAPDAGQYARLLKAAAPAVRAADPSAKVLFAGLAYNDYPYLEHAYAAVPDLGDHFDVMATHPYTKSGQSPAIVDRAPDGRMTTTSFLAFEEVRDVMRAHGDDKPIWLTEMGWSTNSQVLHPLGGVSEAVQAAHLALAFELLQDIPYVEVAVVYNFRNNYWADDADNWEDQLGLLRTDFSRKPAYHVFAGLGRTAAPAADKPAPAAPATDAAVAQPPLALEPAAAPEVTLQVTKVKRGFRRTSMRVIGRLSATMEGRAKIVLERRKDGRWARVSSLRAAVRGGRFAKSLSVRRGGHWRVKATVAASAGTLSARPVSLRG